MRLSATIYGVSQTVPLALDWRYSRHHSSTTGILLRLYRTTHSILLAGGVPYFGVQCKTFSWLGHPPLARRGVRVPSNFVILQHVAHGDYRIIPGADATNELALPAGR